MEPVNTCLKAVVQIDPRAGDVVCILGQGPIGLIFTMMLRRIGCKMLTTDTFAARRELARRFGAMESYHPVTESSAFETKVRDLTDGRGADLVIVAASAPGIVDQAIRCTRPGAKILLFAQTSDAERIEVSGASICKDERILMGAYSASVDLQSESARMVFSGDLPLEQLVSHRVPLHKIAMGIDLALHPGVGSLKIVVQPQRW